MRSISSQRDVCRVHVIQSTWHLNLERFQFSRSAEYKTCHPLKLTIQINSPVINRYGRKIGVIQKLLSQKVVRFLKNKLRQHRTLDLNVGSVECQHLTSSVYCMFIVQLPELHAKIKCSPTLPKVHLYVYIHVGNLTRSAINCSQRVK